MKSHISSTISALILGFAASSVQSQSIYTDMASGIAKQGIAEAEKLLDEAPNLLGDALQRAEQGQAYETPEYCRGALQAVVNIGAIVANITPFSKIWTFEDDRGPVGKFRIMLNGEQIHTEIYCDENLMMASVLEWGTGNNNPEEVEMNSFSALAGAMLIMKLQGVFDDAESAATVTEQESEVPPKIIGFDLTADGLKIVNFWASWCTPCLVERPLLQEMADLGIPIYGVNYKDDEQDSLNFLAEHGNVYSSEVSDASGRIGLDWGVYGIPESFIISSEGRIIDRIEGPITKDILDNLILPNVGGSASD